MAGEGKDDPWTIDTDHRRVARLFCRQFREARETHQRNGGKGLLRKQLQPQVPWLLAERKLDDGTVVIANPRELFTVVVDNLRGSVWPKRSITGFKYSARWLSGKPPLYFNHLALAADLLIHGNMYLEGGFTGVEKDMVKSLGYDENVRLPTYNPAFEGHLYGSLITRSCSRKFTRLHTQTVALLYTVLRGVASGRYVAKPVLIFSLIRLVRNMQKEHLVGVDPNTIPLDPNVSTIPKYTKEGKLSTTYVDIVACWWEMLAVCIAALSGIHVTFQVLQREYGPVVSLREVADLDVKDMNPDLPKYGHQMKVLDKHMERKNMRDPKWFIEIESSFGMYGVFVVNLLC